MVRRRGTRERLEDIRDTAEDALAFAAGLDDAAFAALPGTDRRTYRALKNALAEIGEAVKLLPPELLARHPEVDWRGWAGLRDIVSHPYFSLDLPRLRPTTRDELPALLAAVRSELDGSCLHAPHPGASGETGHPSVYRLLSAGIGLDLVRIA